MRKRICVPMIGLCLLLSGCGKGEEIDIRQPFREMEACTAEAVVSCAQEESLWQATLRCSWSAEGKTEVEVLSPETIAGIRAVLNGETMELEYEDVCLNAGSLSRQKLSPALCIPRLISALREGWLLEENRESWEETPCYRLLLDQTGADGGKILSAVWLNEETGMPLRGEISVEGEQILTAEFTDFSTCDTMNTQANP